MDPFECLRNEMPFGIPYLKVGILANTTKQSWIGLVQYARQYSGSLNITMDSSC